MRCRYCGQPQIHPLDPMVYGYHMSCFTTKVRREQAKKGTKEGDESWQEFQAQVEEEIKKQREAKQQQEEEQKRERERRKQRTRQTSYGFQGNNPFSGYEWFRTFFEGHYGMGADEASGESEQTSWDGSAYERARRQQAGMTVVVDRKKVIDLLRLCHPDKHENSTLSVETTKWLNGIKDQMDGKT